MIYSAEWEQIQDDEVGLKVKTEICKSRKKKGKIRKQRNIKQEDFAKHMGVSRQTISSLENGRYNPSIILAYKIAKYFGMSIEDVFVFEDEDLK